MLRPFKSNTSLKKKIFYQKANMFSLLVLVSMVMLLLFDSDPKIIIHIVGGCAAIVYIMIIVFTFKSLKVSKQMLVDFAEFCIEVSRGQ